MKRLGRRKTPHDKSSASIGLVAPLPPRSPATVNCARALHFHEILAGLYCHLRSLFLSLLTNLRLLSDSEAGLDLMHEDGGARRRPGASRIDEDSVRGAETNMLQSARCVCVCVCVCVQEAGWDKPCVSLCSRTTSVSDGERDHVFLKRLKHFCGDGSSRGASGEDVEHEYT